MAARAPQTRREFAQMRQNGLLPRDAKWSQYDPAPAPTVVDPQANAKQVQAYVAAQAPMRAQEATERAGKVVTDERGTTTYDAQGNAAEWQPSDASKDEPMWAGQEYGFQRAEDAQDLWAQERKEQHDTIQKELDATDAEKWDREHGVLPGTNAAFGVINNGLTQLADVAADTLLPPSVSAVYKTFAPPGSKYHTDGDFASKVMAGVSSAVGSGMPRGERRSKRARPWNWVHVLTQAAHST